MQLILPLLPFPNHHIARLGCTRDTYRKSYGTTNVTHKLCSLSFGPHFDLMHTTYWLDVLIDRLP